MKLNILRLQKLSKTLLIFNKVILKLRNNNNSKEATQQKMFSSIPMIILILHDLVCWISENTKISQGLESYLNLKLKRYSILIITFQNRVIRIKMIIIFWSSEGISNRQMRLGIPNQINNCPNRNTKRWRKILNSINVIIIQ